MKRVSDEKDPNEVRHPFTHLLSSQGAQCHPATHGRQRPSLTNTSTCCGRLSLPSERQEGHHVIIEGPHVYGPHVHAHMHTLMPRRMAQLKEDLHHRTGKQEGAPHHTRQADTQENLHTDVPIPRACRVPIERASQADTVDV